MADEMDPCECIWNHEMAMRRLISLLRQSQTYCTDVECLEEVPGTGLQQSDSAGNSFIVMFLMMALAVAMYAMRPRRAQILDAVDAAKPARDTQDRDGSPPSPPRT